ncbi:hypothetical protein E4U42_002786 [Claviceps africana]|uniref:Protein kinase domain-containing protein n=1 Tax=Claviceps africana TaxID=83212 RepID=A0A8K0J7R6_9HYPO|nr:hypothetical protein E4U42_002786 [Claviceps africana]
MSSAGTSRPTAPFCHDELNNSRSNGHEDHVPKFSAKRFDTNSDPTSPAALESQTFAPSTPLPRPQQSVQGNGYSSPIRSSPSVSAPFSTSSLERSRESRPADVGSSPLGPLDHKTSSGSILSLTRTPSLKAAFVNSTLSSPVITAMGDMTPLPSPLLSGDSPGPWGKLSVRSTPPPHIGNGPAKRGQQTTFAAVMDNNQPAETDGPDEIVATSARRKQYGDLGADGRTAASTPTQNSTSPTCAHLAKDRSVSEYVPDATSQPHKRNVVVSGSHVNSKLPADGQESLMRREFNFAESRGITSIIAQPPTPPPSESSKDSNDGTVPKDGGDEWFEALGRHDKKRRRWRSIGFLGQGTFSRVMLASSQTLPIDRTSNYGQPIESSSPIVADEKRRRKLVAVKICEHGPRGGASEERIEMSLKRELEIMQDIHHPSLVNLKAWSIEPSRAILVLSYCPGGDLFDIATAQKKLITPAILRRMYAEIIGAVKYLHDKNIVHRDIKLENVLVNLTPLELADAAVDWTKFPTSVITLADLGLSRRIADDEKLETRCGSDDYAAPEVIMGQPYDGRATDAWSLGVLLYALLESRLPFDPHPGMSDAHRMRSRTSHRIARVEWRWVDFAGEDGDHDASEAKFNEQGLLGAMEITEGLLKRARSRWTVDKVANQPWVRDAIQVEGGIRFRDEDEGQEI